MGNDTARLRSSARKRDRSTGTGCVSGAGGREALGGLQGDGRGPGCASLCVPCLGDALQSRVAWLPTPHRPDRTGLLRLLGHDGAVDVEVVSQRPVETVAIRPAARGIQPQVEGNRIRFRLDTPQQIVVEVNGRHKACTCSPVRLRRRSIPKPPACAISAPAFTGRAK